MRGSLPTEPACTFDPLIPFDAPVTLPDMPIAAFPRSLADMIREVSRVIDIEPDAVGSLMLGIITACCGVRFKVEVGTTHDEPLAIWTVTFLPSGSRKTATLDRLMKPVRAWEKDALAKIGPKAGAINAQREVIEKRIEVAKKAAVRDECDVATEVEALEREKPPEVPQPELLIQNVTPESLGRELSKSAGRGLLTDDEGGVFDIMAGSYSKTSKPSLDTYLKAHAGSRISVKRITRDADLIEHPALSIALIVQPTILNDLSVPAFRSKGLLARFLFSLPTSRIGRRMYRPSSVDVDVEAEYESVLKRLLGEPLIEFPEPQSLLIAGEAIEAWADFANEIETAMGPDGPLAHMTDWGSKAAGAVARIAAVFELVKRGSAVDGTLISRDSIDRAVAILRYFVSHSIAALEEIGVDPRKALAKRILEWIVNESLERFSRRDCHRKFRGSASVDDLIAPLEILEERGYIVGIESRSRSVGRKPGPVYLVNPAAHKRATPLDPARSHEREDGQDGQNAVDRNCDHSDRFVHGGSADTSQDPAHPLGVFDDEWKEV